MTTSNALPTPPGEDAPAAGTHRALNQDEAIPQDLLQAVLASDNLARAWKRVKSNKGAPGIDGVTVQDWPAHARDHWPALRAQIEGGRYEPQPVRRVEIPKPGGGGNRLLGIPAVSDRVVQQAIAQVLTPIFDPTFSESSFGFRPGRNAHQAIRQVQAYVKDGFAIAVDIDLAKFFDTVNQDLLMSLLGRTIADKRLLHLIGRILRAGVLVGEHIEPSDIGTPQGGPLSPLLANLTVSHTESRL
jgi:RNA-directed DNA polymerase